MMSAEAVGFLDDSQANIIIQSSAPEETIRQLKDMALKAWTAGEALANEIPIEPTLVVNGEHWEKYRATPGTTDSDVSTLDGLQLSYITDAPLKSDYIPQVVVGIGDQSMDYMSNLKFQILATSESAGNSSRPQLKKITVSFNHEASETWEIYSDELSTVDSSDAIPVAPTSLEYVTAGTALCLTSQVTLVSAMMDLDYTDFRVEQQINYREEAVNTTEMASYADLVKSIVMIESDESEERLNRFFKQSLSMCFAGEGFSGATEMIIHSYLNGQEI
ncbi:OsmC family protein [Leucothrix pacifica]|nr:OsmC family protein [Leucothrix pacifica]